MARKIKKQSRKVGDIVTLSMNVLDQLCWCAKDGYGVMRIKEELDRLTQGETVVEVMIEKKASKTWQVITIATDDAQWGIYNDNFKLSSNWFNLRPLDYAYLNMAGDAFVPDWSLLK